MDDLRDNKPMKNMGSMVRQEEDSISCRECGKGFPSRKALYGHMRCHSKRENNNVVVAAAAAALPPWSSRKMRFYNKTATASSSSFSFSVSEIDQEQIEAAQTLMMLSRDVGFNSQTSSLVLEAQIRSSDEGKRNLGKRDGSFYFSSDENENLKSLKTKKLDSVISNSGFLNLGLKKVQSKVSAGYVELGKNLSINKKGNVNRSKLDYIEAEFGDDSIEEAETMDGADSKFGKFDHNSRKRSRIDDASDSEKRNRFVCTTCNKSFDSHQALGGHRSSHKKIKSCIAPRIESNENTDDASVDQIEEEEHDGEINGVAEASCYDQTIVIQQELSEIHQLLDLNLPPTEEE